MANDVTATHPDYEAALPGWTLVADAAAGERAIKAKRETYLPKPNCKDTSKENTERYNQYILRAAYLNATGHTVKSLSGLAFRRWPEIALPPAMKDFQNDVTGGGVPLVQHAQSTLARLLQTGRCGLLADYPATEGPTSVADQTNGGIQPTISFYAENAITNWRTARRGAKQILSLVVLRETYEVDSGFEVKCELQYRVLRLLSTGYQVELWRKHEDAVTKRIEWRIAEPVRLPKQGNGQPWREIPFQFVGSQNNDTAVDVSPCEDIATLNIHHYQNSADYEDSVFFCGQPQVWMAGLDQEWVKLLKDNGVYFGSRAILPLPIGGSCGIIQAAPNTLAKGAMDQKEAQMGAMGARLLMPGFAEVQKTATETNSDDAAAHSVLSLCCDNASLAYKQVLAWCANFQNVPGDIEFSIPTEFTKIIDAATAAILLQLVQAGKLPEADFWSALRVAGFIDSEKTDDTIREELSTQLPEPGTTLTDEIVDDNEPGDGAETRQAA